MRMFIITTLAAIILLLTYYTPDNKKEICDWNISDEFKKCLNYTFDKKSFKYIREYLLNSGFSMENPSTENDFYYFLKKDGLMSNYKVSVVVFVDENEEIQSIE